MTGAWYMTCFVIVTAYSSVLVSFLTAPDSYKPLIQSVNELPSKPEIKITINKGFIMDIISKVKRHNFIQFMDYDIIYTYIYIY